MAAPGDGDREIEQLRDTLAAYHESATTEHLYELSRYLLDEIVERVSRLDGKAGRFASYSGAIMALLLRAAALLSSLRDGLAWRNL